ncbi:MAG: hypothetical protein ACYCPQ_06125 [Elusimicrobiota bacterium]
MSADPGQPGAVAPRTETVKIRGLSRLASFFFGFWGAVVFLKSCYDLFWGEPEANLYAPEKWDFVTRPEWLRYAGFEMCYGLCCLALAVVVWRFGHFFPETIERPVRKPDFDLF